MDDLFEKSGAASAEPRHPREGLGSLSRAEPVLRAPASVASDAESPRRPHAIDDRIAALDWPSLAAQLDAKGSAVVPGLLSAGECASLAAMYDEDRHFRSRVVMARHGYGRGEYRYFAYPLPDTIGRLRSALYPPLSAIANRWNATMGIDVTYPPALEDFLARCHGAGQTRPTPLVLRYGAGDYNCLHQDLYGEHVFPLQVAILLSKPGEDFAGGEFVLTEQRPRMQSRVEVIPLAQQGDAVIFAVNQRPHQGSKGPYRVKLRHGVSTVHSGRRHVAGVIFHDAA